MPAAIVLGTVALGTAIYGGIKSAQAAKAAKANLANRPTYTPLPEDDSELNLAESNAATGMSDASKQALLNNNQSAQAASINAIQRNGGDANSIGSTYQAAQNGLNQNAIYDDTARQQHLNTLMGVYSSYNAQRNANNDKQFQVNQYAPWADRQQLYTQQQAAGQQLMMSGISSLGKAAGAYAGGGGSDTSTGNGATAANNYAPNYSGIGQNSWYPTGQMAPVGQLPISSPDSSSPQWSAGIVPFYGTGS